MSFETLPDDILIRLLKETSPRDVARLKRVNRRTNHIAERYNLGRPVVDEFSLKMRTSPPATVGRLRLGPMKTESKKKIVVTMRRKNKVKEVEAIPSCSTSEPTPSDLVRNEMKKVVLNEKLSFDGIKIDTDFYRALTARWNDLKKVTHLNLTFCQIDLTPQQFADLVSRMSLKQLFIEFCTMDQTLLSDKVFECLHDIECIKIQPRGVAVFSQLTDATLTHWATNKLPTTINFYNCYVGWSVDGVRRLMHSAIIKDFEQFEWDFGMIHEMAHVGSVLLNLVFSPGLALSVQDDFQARLITLRSVKNKFQVRFSIPIRRIETTM